MDPTSILVRLNELNKGVSDGVPLARGKMLVEAQALVASLQIPSELIQTISWAEPGRYACLRIALDLKILETMSEKGDVGASIAELAKVGGADEDLVARIMKHLAAMHLVSEPTAGVYAHTALSRQLTEPKYRDGILFNYDIVQPTFRDIPAYLSQTAFKDPQDSHNGVFQLAHSTDKRLFPYLAANPKYRSAFANYMSGYRAGKHEWFQPDFYPVEAELIEPVAKSSDGIVLVDVGGGKGHDILALHSQFPQLANKLILQDKPEVIASIDPALPETIKAMAYDFFTPQPVQHARAYFLHSILHDWNDEDCIRILKILKPALKAGYSKVLINELMVPDKGASWPVTSMDMVMMVLNSAKERTEAHFKKIFNAAGLRIDKVWTYEPGTESLIEASLA